MINFNLSIDNPFSERFAILAWTSKMLTKYKAVEASVYKDTTIITVSLDYSIRQDHAGLRIVIGLFGYECQIQIHDTRHWDYEKNQWESHD